MFTFWQLVKVDGYMTYSFQKLMTIYPEGLVEVYRTKGQDDSGD